MQTGVTGPEAADIEAADIEAPDIETPDIETPTAALLVGALYQLAAEPDDWADFVRHLARDGGAADPDAQTLSAMVVGAEQVARSAAARAGPADTQDAVLGAVLAVLAVSDGGRRVAGNTVARCSPLARLITEPGETSLPDQLESLRQAQARVTASAASPTLVRLHVSDDPQPVFAYAMAFERLPAALRQDLGQQPRGTLAIVAHAGQTSETLGGGLTEAFGLTPAEVRLALALCGGDSLRDVAIRSGISFNTVRNQLNAIFEKVGVNRQSELVRSLTDLGQLWRRVDGGERRTRVRAPPGFAPAPRHLRLADGRGLTYRQYGAPEGRAVLVFHGGLGASLLPPGTDATARRLNLRIVAPERAGVGRSATAAGRPGEIAIQDMIAVIDHLELGGAQFLSFTSGAQFALATAAASPDLASRLLLLSPRPPMATKGAPTASPMVALQRRLRAHPWLAEAFFAVTRLRLSGAIVRQIMQASAVSRGDAAYLAAHPETYDLITLGVHEALTRTGQGTAVELASGTTVTDVAALGPLPTVTVWHGAEDAYATPAEVEAWLGPALSELTVFPDIGNYAALKHWPDALDWLAATNRG